jgi:DNA-binding NtrC family response regulator
VVRVKVPPLRERREDIPLLVARYWDEARERAVTTARLCPDALAALARYDWPGNVRELQNVLAALAVHAPPRGRIGGAEVAAVIGLAPPAEALTLEQARARFEQEFVRGTLARAGGRRGRAARELGLTRQGMAKLLKRLDLERA